MYTEPIEPDPDDEPAAEQPVAATWAFMFTAEPAAIGPLPRVDPPVHPKPASSGGWSPT